MNITPPVNGATRIRPGRRASLKQLLEMQRVLYVTTMESTTKPMERASCARSWEVLEERKRIIRGKLKAGSFNAHQVGKPESDRARKRKPFGLAEIAHQIEMAAGMSPEPAEPRSQ